MNTSIKTLLEAVRSAIESNDKTAAVTALRKSAQGFVGLAEVSPNPKRRQYLNHAKAMISQALEIQSGQPISAPAEMLAAIPERVESVESAADTIEPSNKETEIPDINLEDVIGLEEVKSALKSKFIYPLRNPEIAKAYKQTGSGGVLLYGPPGTGKTMLARALAGELKIPLFVIDGKDLSDKYVGESEKNISRLFAQAREKGEAMIFIDELEAILPSRESSQHENSTKMISQFLTEMDGFTKNNGRLIILGGTNYPWLIDRAILRPGRFDELVYVGLPSAEAREAIIKSFLEGMYVSSTIELPRIVELTEGYSAAEVKEVALRAAQIASESAYESNKLVAINMSHIEKAQKKIIKMANPSLLQKYESFKDGKL